MIGPTKKDMERGIEYVMIDLDVAVMEESEKEFATLHHARGQAAERDRITKKMRKLADLDQDSSPNDRVEGWVLLQAFADFLEGRLLPEKLGLEIGED